MSEIRTAEEMREAAAQVVLAYPNASPWEKAQRIRALPVADDVLSDAMEGDSTVREPFARAIVVALREAGALR